MRYRYFVDFWHGISVFANFSYGIAVLGTLNVPLFTKWHEIFLSSTMAKLYEMMTISLLTLLNSNIKIWILFCSPIYFL